MNNHAEPHDSEQFALELAAFRIRTIQPEAILQRFPCGVAHIRVGITQQHL